MEFSEINELQRVLKTASYFEFRGARSASDKMIDYNLGLEQDLDASPPCTIPDELCNSLPEEFLNNPTIIVEDPKEPPESELKVEKDDNFKENYYESIAKVSTLTDLLKDDSELQRNRRKSSDRFNNFVDLTIYLFGTMDTLIISVPYTTTIDQLIGKIITAYLKSDLQLTKPLPKGPVIEAYQIWLIDEEH